MKKKFLRNRIRYWFDCMMSKGTFAMSMMLFGVSILVMILVGVLASVFSNGSVTEQVWISLMHIIDTGALGANPMDNVPYLILMSLATLCGMFLTSILIGIIISGIETKLGALRKGTSVVEEENHTVIIGFDEMIYTIIQEIVIANSNKKKACVVVLGTQPKEEMEEAISSHIPNTKTTRVICRSGKLYETYALERCSVETSKSVIVNSSDDAETIKIILALSDYLRDKKLIHPNLRFVASLQDNQYMEVAKIAGEGRTEVVYAKDAIARIIANTCRQHGLSQVMTELFNFEGNELYFESIPQLVGKTFHEAMLSFSNAIVVGLYVNEQVYLNPPMDTVIGETDQLILLEEDDGAYNLHEPKVADEEKICNGKPVCGTASNHLVVFGSNEKLPIILAEYDKYVEPGTSVVIVDDDVTIEELGPYNNLNVTNCDGPVSRELLNSFHRDKVDNLLLLNDDSQDFEASDSQTLLKLILLRDIADKTDWKFSVTTEMRSADNQRLASQARVDDFVIGSNFACLLLAQISENPNVAPLIAELLDESGSELYMKSAADYVTIGEELDSYTITESVARKGEIYVGYRHIGKEKKNVVVNPHKEETIVFGEKDQIIVISQN